MGKQRIAIGFHKVVVNDMCTTMNGYLYCVRFGTELEVVQVTPKKVVTKDGTWGHSWPLKLFIDCTSPVEGARQLKLL